MSPNPKYIGALIVIASGFAAYPAVSEDAPAGAGRVQMDDIVVTARKREERLGEVPMAVTAFTADDLAKRNVESLYDVAKFTAGFSFESYAGGVTPAPIIRGLSQNTLTDRNQNVATFVDGVHIQQQGNIDFGLLDVERIEVLKGPQNAQYGHSAFAGAINYIASKPVLGEWDGKVGLTAGTDERYEARGSLSIPVWKDVLAVRIYGVTSEFDGTWNNNFSGGDAAVGTTDGMFGKSFDGTDGNLGGWDNDAWHAQVLFQPIESLRIGFGYYDSTVSNEQAAIEFIRPQGSSVWGLSNETNCNPSTATGLLRFVCGELNVDADTVRVDPRSVGLQADTVLRTFRVDWDISDALSMSYLFGDNDLDANSFGHTSSPPNPELEGCGFFASSAPPCNPPGTPTAILFQTGPSSQDATSHEVRFNGVALDEQITWQLGYYHSKIEDTIYINSVESRRSLIQDPTGQVVLAAFPFPASNYEDKIDAYFGAFGVTFADIYTLDLEARYSEENRAQTTGTLAPRNYYSFTPRVSLRAQFSPDLMVYGSVATGEKSGGFNTVTADPGFETYEPEKNTTYEIGAKQTLLDGALQLNYDIFYIDWTDLQLPTPDLIPFNPASPRTDSNYITNVSGASSYGVELELVALLSDNWEVDFSGSWVKPEFDSDALDFGLGAQCAGSSAPVCPSVVISRPPYPDAAASPIGGNQLARTPSIQLAAGLQYTSQFGSGWEYRLRGDVSYQDKQYAEVLNVGYLPERTLLDVNFMLTAPKGDWSVTLWGKNVTDEEYVSNSFVIGFANNWGASLAPGAAWGVTAAYAFGSNN